MSTQEEEEEEEEEQEGEGEQQLVKNGFFSEVKFSALPLSAGMLAALAKLEFSTTTKIQASYCDAGRPMHRTPVPLPLARFDSFLIGWVYASPCIRSGAS